MHKQALRNLLVSEGILKEASPLPISKSIARRMSGGSRAVEKGVAEILQMVPGTDYLQGPPGAFKGRTIKLKPGKLRWMSRTDANKVKDTLATFGFEAQGGAARNIMWKPGVWVHFIPVPEADLMYGKVKTPNQVLVGNNITQKTMFFLDKLLGEGWGDRRSSLQPKKASWQNLSPASYANASDRINDMSWRWGNKGEQIKVLERMSKLFPRPDGVGTDNNSKGPSFGFMFKHPSNEVDLHVHLMSGKFPAIHVSAKDLPNRDAEGNISVDRHSLIYKEFPLGLRGLASAHKFFQQLMRTPPYELERIAR